MKVYERKGTVWRRDDVPRDQTRAAESERRDSRERRARHRVKGLDWPSGRRTKVGVPMMIPVRHGLQRIPQRVPTLLQRNQLWLYALNHRPKMNGNCIAAIRVEGQNANGNSWRRRRDDAPERSPRNSPSHDWPDHDHQSNQERQPRTSS